MKNHFYFILLFTLLNALSAQNISNNQSSHREKALKFYNLSGMSNWKQDFANKMYTLQLIAHSGEIEKDKLIELVAKTTLRFEEDINIQSIQLIFNNFTENELDTLINLYSGKIGKKLISLDSLVANSEDIKKLSNELRTAISDEIENEIINSKKR